MSVAEIELTHYIYPMWAIDAALEAYRSHLQVVERAASAESTALFFGPDAPESTVLCEFLNYLLDLAVSRPGTAR